MHLSGVQRQDLGLLVCGDPLVDVQSIIPLLVRRGSDVYRLIEA